MSTSNAPGGRLCFQCKQLGHLKKDCPELPYCSKCKTRATFQPSVLPRGKMADSQMKEVKVLTEDLTKDAKLADRIGRKHRTSLSSLTKTTDALTVQVITGPVTAQQDRNHRHPLLAILLTVQVFTKTTHSFKIILPNNIHNKVPQQLTYQLPP